MILDLDVSSYWMYLFNPLDVLSVGFFQPFESTIWMYLLLKNKADFPWAVGTHASKRREFGFIVKHRFNTWATVEAKTRAFKPSLFSWSEMGPITKRILKVTGGPYKWP